MHCQPTQLRLHVLKACCRSFIRRAQQFSSSRRVLINSRLGPGRRCAQKFAAQKTRKKRDLRFSRSPSASAAPNAMLDDLSQAVDLKQACLIAAGVYCLWKLATFIRADADLSLWSKRSPPTSAFEDQVVWITGASQGLGEELALYFAAHGARLILSSRKEDQLQRVKERCVGKHAPSGIRVLPFDLIGEQQELQQAVAQAVVSFPGAPLSYLVHNAGASQHALAEDTTPEVTQKLFQLNTLAPINLTQALLPYILQPQHRPGDSPATGTAKQPRSIYTGTGLISTASSDKGSSKRMAPARAAHLIGKAAYYKVDECWIARHPVLFMGYLLQYTPSLGMLVMKMIGPGRAAQMKGGSSGYDVKSMLFGKGNGKNE